MEAYNSRPMSPTVRQGTGCFRDRVTSGFGITVWGGPRARRR
jgi:hypothetical protein